MASKDNPVAININFDSMSEAVGFPSGFRDPAFFEGYDRLVDLADSLGLKLTFFVIGKDLENPEHFARVRDWATRGHEVGNHSWSHRMSLGSLPREEIAREVMFAHDIISSCTGVEPRGFIAPAWSTSGKLVAALIKAGYEYDTSLFPSLFLYPMLAKMLLNHITQPHRLGEIINRSDYLVPLRCPMRPVYVDDRLGFHDVPGEDRILSLPLPNDNRLRAPLWHTLGFVFGWEYLDKRLRRLLENYPAFYYLLHPADFIGAEDMTHGVTHSLERMDVPLEMKMTEIRKVFETIATSSRPSVTLGDMVRQLKSPV